MNESTTRKITARDAAQIIYSTSAPSDAQLESVNKMLVYGVLAGEQGGPLKRAWHTTTGAVAELMARRALKKADGRSTSNVCGDAAASAHKAIDSNRFFQKAESELRGAYGEAMRDYFLAVMFRRKFLARGVAFQRTVLYGQLAVVMLIVSMCATATWAAFKPEPAHHAAVRGWIATEVEDYKIQTWYPTRLNPNGDGLLVPVRYRYALPNRRSVETERTFVVVDGKVLRQFNEEVEDG